MPAFSFFVLTWGLLRAEDPAAKSLRAKEMMSSGRFEEAIPIYKELVAALPGNPGLLLNLGIAEHMAGHERESVPLFEQVLKGQPKLVPALLSLGAARLALKQFDKAAEQYRKLTEIAPDDPRVWYDLGMTYQSMAVDAFERLHKLGQQSPYIEALIADTRVQKHQYKSAFFFYREALNELPRIHGLHAALAEIYRKTGHLDWALAEDAKEQALPPADCASHVGECRFLAGHDLQSLTAGISPEALYWRAKAANELSMQALVRLGQLPDSMELHQVRAEIARDQNQHLESVKEWRAALDLAPENRRLQHELAVSYFLAADYRAALDVAEKVLRKDPRSPEMNFTAGDSWLRLEEPEKAVSYLRAALGADPAMRAADASLGLSLSRLGRFPEAIPHLEKALELDDDGSLNYQLARAYQAAGNQTKAHAAMARYQELQKTVADQKEEAAKEAQITPPQ